MPNQYPQAFFKFSYMKHYLCFSKVAAEAPAAAASLERLGRLSFWLLMSSIAMFANFISIGFIVKALLDTKIDPMVYFTLVLVFSFSRISISHAQVGHKWNKVSLLNLSMYSCST